MDTADVLERAADLLWVRGRCRVKLEEDDGRLCAVGAICRAANVDLDYEAAAATGAVKPFAEYLRINSPTDIEADDLATVYWFNDDDTVDDGEVIDAFRHCAKELRADV